MDLHISGSVFSAATAVCLVETSPSPVSASRSGKKVPLNAKRASWPLLQNAVPDLPALKAARNGQQQRGGRHLCAPSLHFEKPESPLPPSIGAEWFSSQVAIGDRHRRKVWINATLANPRERTPEANKELMPLTMRVRVYCQVTCF